MSSHSVAAGFVGCWRWRVPCLLAIENASEVCSVCHVAFLQWWSACCHGGGAPSIDHGSLGQRKTYVSPRGHLILLQRAVASRCRSFCGATARLNLVVMSFQSDEGMVDTNQVADHRIALQKHFCKVLTP